MKGKKLLTALLSVTMTVSVAAFAMSCKPKEESPDYGENGAYYSETVNGDEWALTLIDKALVLTTEDGTVTGSYAFDGKNFEVTVSGGTLKIEADGANVLTVTYNGNTYRFYRSVNYTVSYDVGGTVTEVKVRNGKTATAPQNPEKAGYHFIGWYTDAAYTNRYNFALPVTEDVALYARFEAAAIGQEEWTATLMNGSVKYAEVETIGGVLYDLPVLEAKNGKEFSGWYISDAQDAEKLTYKYDGRKLSADTVLYAVWKSAAPEVTISANGEVSWTQKAGVTYTVNVYKVTVAGEVRLVNNQTSVSGKLEGFDFGAQEAGEYRITVSDGTNESEVWYKNKALARVSKFAVVNGVLQYNEVAGAEKYLVTVICGNAEHNTKHVDFDNGKQTTYNFENCEMTAGGIKFVVKAVASGYATSVSDTFVYNLELDKVSGLTVTDGIVSWNKVANAAEYVVEVKQGEEVTKINVGAKTVYSLKDYTGELTISVYPVTKGYNSPEATKITVTKNTLAAPSGLKISGNVLKWNAVDDAQGYAVKVNGTEKTLGNVTELDLSEYISGNVTELKISVKALATNAANGSEYSDEITAKVGEMVTKPEYSNGKVTWGAVLGATKYTVTLNGGADKEVTDGSTEYGVKLNQAGNNTIVIKAYKSGEKAGEYVHLVTESVTVKAYTITFDVRGGTEVQKQYVANGDALELPESSYYGYDFKGWYDLPGGAADNGRRYASGDKYDKNANVTLYAYWESAVVEVLFDTMGVGAMNEDDLEENEIGQYVKKVTFGKSYKLPVPDEKTVISSTTFGGWYTEPNGQGERYTDENGTSLGVWGDAQQMTLYAVWFETLTYTKVYDMQTGKYGYSVTKGPDIANVTTVKIPAKHTDGLPITTVESGAFKSCSNLVSIEIPDSIQNVVTGYMDENGTEVGSAFASCYKLEAVNVYEVEGSHDKLWSSIDGVLFYDNKLAGTGIELRYVPSAIKAGEDKTIVSTYGDGKTQFTVPEGVTTLPLNALASSTFNRIVVPYTVTKVEAKAFSSAAASEIIFEATPADKTASELVITSNTAFKYSKAETIILPGRIAETDFVDIFGASGTSSYLSSQCSSLKAIGFSEASARYEAVSLNDEIKATMPDGTAVTCGVIVDKQVASHKKVVFCPAKYTGAQEVGGATVNKIVIPASVAEIGDRAFANTSAFGSVVISAGVEKIGTEAFRASSLTSVTFEEYDSGNESLQISDMAFYDCKTLGDIEFPARLTSIGEKAFMIASSYSGKSSPMYKVVFNGSESDSLEIKASAFYQLANLSEAVFGKSVKFIGREAFGETKMTAVTLDCGEVEVEAGAFFKVSGITSAKNSKVTSLKIGAGVGHIDIGAAFGANLSNIEIDTNNPNYSVQGDVIFNGDATRLCYYPANLTNKSYTVPASVTVIAPYAFYGNNGTKQITESITIGKNVTEIGYAAFANNKDKKSYVFEASDEGDEKELTLGEYAFASIYACDSISLPGRIKVIPVNAFSDGEWKTVTLGEGTEQILEAAFSTCKFLENVNLPASLSVIAGEGYDFAFYNCEKLKAFDIATGSAHFAANDGILYQKENGVSAKLIFVPQKIEGKVTIPNTVTEMTKEAFYKREITEVTFENNRTESLEIGDMAFYQCQLLTTLNLTDGITKIGMQAFYNCSSLKGVTIPKTVNFIGSRAFFGNSSLAQLSFGYDESVKDELLTFEGEEPYSVTANSRLGMFANSVITEVTLPNRPIALGGATFATCAWLRKITFNTTRMEEIGVAAFANCSSLEELVGFDKITLDEIAWYSFYGTKALQSITLPEGPESIGNYAFDSTSLKTITIPASVKSIALMAFQKAASLESVTFAENSALEEIDSAFTGCSKLSTLVLPEGVKYLGRSFIYGTNIESIVIPASVETIDQNAFMGATLLESITFAENSQLKKIGAKAFMGTAIKSFVFPETASQIDIPVGAALFDGCASLVEVTLSSTVPDVTDSISGCSSITRVYVAEGSKYYSTNEEHTMLLNANKTAIKYICGVLTDSTVNITEGITTIGAKAFSGQWLVEKFVIPASVKKIENNAFENCVSLKEIEFAKGGLASIGSYAFAGCKNLKKLTLPDGLATLGDFAFASSALEEVYIPASVTSLGNSAFRDLKTLKKVSGMEGITSIPEYAFYGSSLAQIEIGDNVTSIGSCAFEYCKNLTSVSGLKNVSSLGTKAFYGSSIYEITFTDQLKKISEGAFQECASLERVKGLDGVTEIVTYAFVDTVSLISLDLPSVTKVGNYAFNGSGITEINLPKVTSLGRSAFIDCVRLSSVKLNDGLTEIGQSAFEGCSALQSIKLPAGLTKLQQSTFKGSGLTSITLPAKLTTIDGSSYSQYGVFKDCVNLASVKFDGNSVSQIGSYAFYGCTALESFNFENITLIDASAFASTGLTAIDLDGIITVGEGAFENCANLATVSGLKGNVAKNLFAGCGFINLDLSQVDSIEEGAFKNNKKLNNLTVGGSAIGKNAFSGCTSLETLTVNESVATVSDSAFSGCTALSTVTLAEGVTTVGDKAFNGCVALSQITLPASLTSVGASAFAGCSLVSVNVPEKLTAIGENAFDCSTLSSYIGGNEVYTVTDGVLLAKDGSVVDWPSAKTIAEDGSITLPALREYAFYNNPQIKKAVISSNIVEIPAYAFAYSGIEEIVIPASVKEISKYAFRGASSLAKVTFEEESQLSEIGEGAFENCTSLTSVALGSVEKIDNNAFKDSGVTSIVLPDSLTDLGENVFENCVSLASVTVNSTKITEIPVNTFSGCVALQSLNAEGDEACAYIPENVLTFGERAFYNTGFKKVIFHEKITKIAGKYAYIDLSLFADCAQLAEVEFKGKVTELCNGVFTNCVNLSAVKFANSTAGADGTVVFPSTFTAFGDLCFANTGITGVEIPSSVTSFGRTVYYSPDDPERGYGAFARCAKLKKVTIKANNVMGGGGTFANCTALETVDLNVAYSYSAKISVDYLFAGCTAINSVTVGSNLPEIGSKAFVNCTALKTITIPSNVTKIGDNAFMGSGLESITFTSGRTSYNKLELGRGVFENCASLTSISLPELKALSLGTTGAPYTEWFRGCTSLETVVFEAGINIIGKGTFSGCSALKNLSFEKTDTSAGINIPDGVVVGNNAFEGLASTVTINCGTSYYHALGLWDTDWYNGCNATVIMAGVNVTEYL